MMLSFTLYTPAALNFLAGFCMMEVSESAKFHFHWSTPTPFAVVTIPLNLCSIADTTGVRHIKVNYRRRYYRYRQDGLQAVAAAFYTEVRHNNGHIVGTGAENT